MNDTQTITPDAQAADDEDTEGHDIALGSSFTWETDAPVGLCARKNTAERQNTAGKGSALNGAGDGPSDAHDVRLTRHDEDDVEGHAVFCSGSGHDQRAPGTSGAL